MSANIALVDDDRNILTSVSIAMQAEGFVTRVYSDSEAALHAILDNPPDLAIFDIKMPKMDGLELLRRVREKSNLPVIFLTSKDEELDEALGLAVGASFEVVTNGRTFMAHLAASIGSENDGEFDNRAFDNLIITDIAYH